MFLYYVNLGFDTSMSTLSRLFIVFLKKLNIAIIENIIWVLRILFKGVRYRPIKYLMNFDTHKKQKCKVKTKNITFTAYYHKKLLCKHIQNFYLKDFEKQKRTHYEILYPTFQKEQIFYATSTFSSKMYWLISLLFYESTSMSTLSHIIHW